MKTKPVDVPDKDGYTVSGDMVVCPDCDGEIFSVVVLHGTHLHFQCETCRTSFCDGTCHELTGN